MDGSVSLSILQDKPVQAFVRTKCAKGRVWRIALAARRLARAKRLRGDGVARRAGRKRSRLSISTRALALSSLDEVEGLSKRSDANGVRLLFDRTRRKKLPSRPVGPRTGATVGPRTGATVGPRTGATVGPRTGATVR